MSDNKTPISKEKEITMDEINNLAKVVNSDLLKKDIANKRNEIEENKEEFLGHIAGLDADRDFLNDKLARFKTTKELEFYLSTNANILEMYTNPETGEVLDIIIVEGTNEMNFRKDLLLYLKETEVQLKNIDIEYEKLDQATKEFQVDVDDACYHLSDNVLLYIEDLKKRANACNNITVKGRMLRAITSIESAFTMQVYTEMYTKYPSAVDKVKKYFNNSHELSEIGRRYFSKLKSAKTEVNLLQFLSEGDRRSFEEIVFAPDEYNTQPDMFAFSLIRYYAMADWNDPSTIQGHGTIALNMRKLIRNELDEEVKLKVKAAILEYLKLFE